VPVNGTPHINIKENKMKNPDAGWMKSRWIGAKKSGRFPRPPPGPLKTFI